MSRAELLLRCECDAGSIYNVVSLDISQSSINHHSSSTTTTSSDSSLIDQSTLYQFSLHKFPVPSTKYFPQNAIHPHRNPFPPRPHLRFSNLPTRNPRLSNRHCSSRRHLLRQERQRKSHRWRPRYRLRRRFRQHRVARRRWHSECTDPAARGKL